MSEHWNTAVTARAVIDTCAKLGVDTEPIIFAAGIDRTTLADPDGRVSLEQMSVFWREALQQSGDPSLGLHAGVSCPPAVYRTLDYVLRSAPTIGEAFELVAKYMALVNTWLLIRPDIGGRECSLAVSTVWGSVPRHVGEYVIGLLVNRVRQVCGTDWAPNRVCFEFSETPDSNEHAKVLGCPVEFNSAATQLVVERVVWDKSIGTADPDLAAVIESHADMLMERLPAASATVRSVREIAARRLPDGDFSLERAAGELAITGRTLQRRLADEGLSFGEIVAEMRLHVAKLRLGDPSISMSEVAFLIGFNEQSSFSRAFKRWTGMSPRDYRKSMARR